MNDLNRCRPSTRKDIDDLLYSDRYKDACGSRPGSYEDILAGHPTLGELLDHLEHLDAWADEERQDWEEDRAHQSLLDEYEQQFGGPVEEGATSPFEQHVNDARRLVHTIRGTHAMRGV